MDDALSVARFQFAFTITYHYLFPQLTMGLALLIVLLKAWALRTGDERYEKAAAFWAKLFAVNFGLGVVTGIPMEFQFGTNWSRFSEAAGGIIGQTLALEGVFAFFLESTFLGLFLFGRRKLGPRLHFATAVAVFLGSWISGFFIVATNAWMQHPVGHQATPAGEIVLTDLGAVLTNPWLRWQYPHVMLGAVLTGSFVMASVGAFYVLRGRDADQGRIALRLAVPVGFLAAVLSAVPTGDQQGRMVALHQPVTLAAMEGHFETRDRAPLTIIGQPNMETLHLDNPILVPGILSFLTWNHIDAEVKGLTEFPREDWPRNIPLLYYSYHVMVGLGTIFIAIMGVSLLLLVRRRLFTATPVLWALLILFPFPYIANTAGWMTAELGRQPWLIVGLMRTAEGNSPLVSAGNALFTLIGFMGMYTLLSVLALLLFWRLIERGPGLTAEEAH